MVRLLRNADVHDTKAEEKTNVNSLTRRCSCQIWPKASETSEARCFPWLSSEPYQECRKMTNRSPVKRRDRNSYWRSLSNLSCSMNERSCLAMAVSVAFELTRGKEIER